ncbi:MAG: fibronectin type III domain-containing protein [Elusimicrobia bacterium]|nr:fibronectin type III domain-containing protein [Candidatus Liberimonas magnetica]
MKKLTLLTLTAVLLSTMSCFADFKFGLLEAVKDASKKLDAAYVKQGGPIPKAPSNLSGIATSITQVNLTWSDNSDNEFGFKIKRSNNGSPFSTIATVDKNITTYSDTSVSPNTGYYYRLQAYNDTGESEQNDPGANTSVTTGVLSISKLGTYTASGTFYKVACLGNYAYLAMDSAFSIVDISNIAVPVLSGSISSGLSSAPKNIAVNGNYAYVAEGTSGLTIINCLNPTAPVIVGTYANTSGNGVTAVKVSGNYAYVGDNNGFEILDVSNPNAPTVIKTLATNGIIVNDIFISGDYAYLANGGDGIRIENISSPSSAYQVTQFSNFSNDNSYNSVNAKALYKSGNYLYVIDNNNGLVVIDVSNPASPQFKGKYTAVSGYNMYDVCVKNNMAYLADYYYGLRIISFADPENPVEAGSYTTTKNCRGLCIYGNYVYSANTSYGMEIYQSNASSTTASSTAPTAPTNLRLSNRTKVSISIAWHDNSDNETGFDIQRKTNSGGTYAWLATMGENSTLYTDSSGLNAGTSYYYRIRAYNSIDATFSDEIGPVILSIDPLVGKYDTPGQSYGVFVSSPYAYVADYNGLRIINISNPTNPANVGSYDISSSYPTNNVTVSGNYAYVTAGYYGLYVLDISNPASISYASNSSAYSNANDVCIKGNYAFVSDSGGSYDMRVFNITNPTSISQVGYHSVAGNAQCIFVSGNYAYIGLDSSYGFQVLNVANPVNSNNFQALGQQSVSGTCYDIYVENNYAYVANGAYGLKIYNVSNPSSMSLVASYSTAGLCKGVYVYGNRLYLAEESSGIEILDITNPAAPSLLKSYQTSATARGVFAKGNYVYVADDTSGLDICDFGIAPSSGSFVPDNPANFQVTQASTTFVNLSWTDNSNNELGFRLYRSTSITSYGVIIATIAANSSSYSNTSLMPNTSFYYTLCAYNSAGNSTNPTTTLGLTKMVPIVEIGNYNPSENYYKVFVTSGIAYASCQTGGLHIINVTNPASPTKKAGFTSKYSYAAFVGNDKAYLATGGYYDLTVLNVSISSSPVERGSVNIGNTGYGVEVAGNKAYVAAGGSGLKIVNISVSSSPVVLGTYDTYTAYDVAVVGNYAYVSDSYYGLRIINISNTSSLTETGSYNPTTNYTAYTTKVSGNYAYVAYGGYGLRVVDISNPSSPTEVGSFYPNVYSSNIYDVFIKGNYAYVIDSYYNYLRILNISDPTRPWEVARFKTSSQNLYGVYVSGNYIYLAANDTGLRILRANLP